jgi:hypothetical protein
MYIIPIKTKNLLVYETQEDNNLHASHLSGFHLLELAPLNIQMGIFRLPGVIGPVPQPLWIRSSVFD